LRGAREIGFTVLAMSISLCAVFIPILLMGGIIGRMFHEFAITLSVAILVSLVVSLTATPMMCSRLLKHRREEEQGWFYRGFGFEPGSIVPALLLFGLLAGVVTFWFSPVAHWWSRRYEYQADAFAAQVMNEPRSLIGALRKLNEKNLSNLTPHPLYSGFYYSHPTLLERERALVS